MTNLPITTSAPQPAVVSVPAANTADAGAAQNSAPFGEVLARQVNAPEAKDTKANDKLAAEVLAQLGADGADRGKTDATIDGAATLPGDMLATLMSQTPATDLPLSTQAAAPSDAQAALPTAAPAEMVAALLPQTANPVTTANTQVAAGVPQEKRGSTAVRADLSAPVQTDAATAKLAPAQNAAIAKEQSFVATLAEAAGRTSPALDLNNAVREITPPVTASPATAAALASLQTTAAPIVLPAQLNINTPVAHEKWADEFNQKITWLASSNQDQTAELHLNPPQLGPLDVVLKVSGDQATALFTSPHAAVREAIEQAMPKLRDMLADNGIMLGNATVSDQAPRDRGESNNPRSSSPADNELRDAPISGNNAVRVSPISRHNGIVDTFA